MVKFWTFFATKIFNLYLNRTRNSSLGDKSKHSNQTILFSTFYTHTWLRACLQSCTSRMCVCASMCDVLTESPLHALSPNILRSKNSGHRIDSGEPHRWRWRSAPTSIADHCRKVGVTIDRKVVMTPKVEITHIRSKVQLSGRTTTE